MSAPPVVVTDEGPWFDDIEEEVRLADWYDEIEWIVLHPIYAIYWGEY